MKQLIHKEKMQKIMHYAAWKMFGTLVVVVTAGLGIWAMAAFTEPTSGPAASVQDFAKNILGANNADNGFDSSAVVANNNGSIIERLKYLEGRTDNGYSACYSKCYDYDAYGTYPVCLSGWTTLEDNLNQDASNRVYCDICCLPR
ncbi:MAG: hypothetical protein WC823_00835 [Parcubacteria group bacterium]|jgi:hypothetical protein